MSDLSDCKQVERGEFVEFWKNNSIVHCLFRDGWQMWFNDGGQLHRDDGPAIVKPDGSELWFENGNFKITPFTARTQTHKQI